MLYPKAFDLCEILKMQEKIFKNETFFVVPIFYCTKRISSQTLKVKIEDGREVL